MSNLAHRQSKIQERRKNTPWREFVMDFASWFPLVLQKDGTHISRYPQKQRYKNLHYDHGRDSSDFFLDYNNNSNFFKELESFFENAPKLGNLNFPNLENCNYAEGVYGGKNCYLSIDVGEGVENILYSSIVLVNCKNIFNAININNNSENIYYAKNITLSLNIYYSKYIHSSNNIWFSTNLLGCQECLFCDDLQNQSYCIYNTQYTKEEYFQKKKELLSMKSSFGEFYDKLTSQPFIRNSLQSNGGGMTSCENIENGYFLTRFSQGRNIMLGEGGDNSSNCFDCFYVGTNAHDYFAMVSSGIDSSQCYCSVRITHSNNIYYSYYLDSCSFCLGCIGIKNKSYCIFNKQYTKEERHEKVNEIFGQMERDGTLGQFFPASMNPFYFNDTAAYLIGGFEQSESRNTAGQFTKEEVTAAGYLWRDEPIKVDIPADAQVISSSELNKYEGFDEQGNRTINANILKVTIQDEEGNYYRIIPMEYKFLVKHGLPLPRKHWLERMKENFRIS